MLQNQNSDIYEIISLKDQIQFYDPNEEDKINNIIWLKQYNSIFPETSNDIQLLKKPNINMINLL